MKLYIPYIVCREFQSQQRLKSKKAMDLIINNLEGLTRNNLIFSTKDLIEEIKNKLHDNYINILEDSEVFFTKWAASINATIIHLSIEQSNKAWDAYFMGFLPLKEPKIRNDIPDSFIVQSIEEILPKIKLLYLVCEDGKIKDTYVDNDKVRVFTSLNEFISLDEIQDELKKLDFIDHLEIIHELIKLYNNKSHYLEVFLGENLGDRLIGEVIEHHTIPDDNNEATISSYDKGNIDINIEKLSYYGDGILGFNFRATFQVSIYFYIFKADYYAMNNATKFSVTDHSDHYYEAESECEVLIEGTIGIKFDYKNFSPDNIEEIKINDGIEAYILNEIKIDIDTINFIGW
ncbi:PIN domain-containing protein [Legionella sp. CNM-4043-24]|uniref:PIN domain-containing protein n=1 Tax=Legionella sp. CNM-4043-24 TaxID=3421646 RepID=UPI00403ADF38